MADQISLEKRSTSYQRIAKSLAHLGETWRDWPDLNSCAMKAGISPDYYQREFCRWAGISPRQYMAMIAHSEAGSLLQQGASVLDTALEIGLSSPSRLHDLFIAHEGLSPGEAKAGGDNVILVYGRAETPFGAAIFLSSERGLSDLCFIDESAGPKTGFEHQGYTEADVVTRLEQRYPKACFVRDDNAAQAWATKIFVSREPIPVALYGTPFRRQIWRALMGIPSGQIKTYGELAKRAGHPKAARAVGTAIGANPVAWLIPCHRVLASDNRLHNYHWGVDRKRAMLTYEHVRRTTEA